MIIFYRTVKASAISAVNGGGLNPSSVYSETTNRTVNLTINYQTLWLNYFLDFCATDYVSNGNVRVTCSDTYR